MIAAFLILQLANTQDGGQNARTRIATMRAMDEQFSFRIDRHIGATNDWSRTPDGAYYSNKAPGPMLYGFPVFFVIDNLHKLTEHGHRDGRGLRDFPGYPQMTGTSILMQAVPYALLAAYVVHLLAGLGVSLFAQGFALFALLFGNTAAVYMSSYFGHGITAVFTLGAIIALLERRYVWLSFCFSSALLCDYGVGMQIPAVAVALGFVLSSVKNKKAEFYRIFRSVLMGAIVPAILWIWYHTVCFGNPFYIANKFQNPGYLDMQDKAVQLWGIFSLPSAEVFWKLIAGPERGILYTQPWVLVLVIVGLFAALRKRYRPIASFCLISLAGLLFMNASFGGWHGGGAAGPRYLSHIFPAFAVWGALLLDELSIFEKVLLWGGLAVAVVFRSLVYVSTTEAPVYSLWNFYLGELKRPSWTPTSRLVLFWIVIILALYWTARKSLFKYRVAINPKRM